MCGALTEGVGRGGVGMADHGDITKMETHGGKQYFAGRGVYGAPSEGATSGMRKAGGNRCL